MDAEPREVTLVRRENCPSCDVARGLLCELSGELGFSVCEVDAEIDGGAWSRYHRVLPVVRVGGITVAAGRVRPELLRQELERAFGPEPWAGVPAHEAEFLGVLLCPACGGELESRPRAAGCLGCGREYSRHEGVLMLQDPPEAVSMYGFMDIVGRAIGFRPKARGSGNVGGTG